MRVRFSVIAFLLLTVPAMAEEEGASVADPANCEALFSSAPLVEKGTDTRVESTADGCRISNIFVGTNDYTRYRIRELTITAPELLDALAKDVLPPEADILATGISLAPAVVDPLFSYILEVQSQPFDVRVRYSWDESDGILAIDEISLSGKTFGRLAFSGRVAGVLPSAIASAREGNPPDVTLQALGIELKNGMLFEAFIVPVIAQALLNDEDPHQQVADYKQNIKAHLAELPEEMLDTDSKAVVADFVENFPHPKGVYTVQITSKDGIDIRSIRIETAEDLSRALQAVVVRATHEAAAP